MAILKTIGVSKVFFILFAGMILSLAVFSHVHAAFLASDLIGQVTGETPNYTTSSINNGSGTSTVANAQGLSMSGGRGVAVDTVNHRLYIPDLNNNRVLIFNLDSTNNLIDHTADYVIGQANFTARVATTSQSGLNLTVDASFDPIHDRLFVSDFLGRRVLVFELSGGITNGMNASYVLGKQDFITNTATTTQNGIGIPVATEFDSVHQRLFVCDSTGNRVLVFDLSQGITTGMNASYVLGQTTFTSGSGATSQGGMFGPSGLSYDPDNDRLFVSEFNNRRVTMFDLSQGITNGMNASYVLGKADFGSVNEAANSSTLSRLYGVRYDTRSKLLFVSDTISNRIMVWNAATSTISNGMGAVFVLGQNDFTSNPTSTSQTGLWTVSGVAIDSGNNRLYVNDSANNRIMIFNLPMLTDNSLTTGTAGSTYSVTLGTRAAQGTTTTVAVLPGGGLPAGLNLSGLTITGTPAGPEQQQFTMRLTDAYASSGTFTYDKTFTLRVISNSTVSIPQAISAGGVVSPSLIPQVTPTLSTSSPNLTTPEQHRTLQAQVQQLVEELSLLQQKIKDKARLQFTFTRNLKLNDKGSDVKHLQEYLIQKDTGPAAQALATHGATSFFGPLTKDALSEFQKAYAISPILGTFGPKTRAFLLK